MVYHGVSDPIFSVNDTTTWYEGLSSNNRGDASDFARFYRVPGMSHCGLGPATDEFEMLSALVNWVEKGEAPTSISAQVRGTGNALGANPDVPAGWSATRSRPLCPYPQVARLKSGATDLESESSFRCE
jgi:feruloyl esterase